MAAPGEPNDGKYPTMNWDLWAKTSGLQDFGPASKVDAIDGGVINFVYRITSHKDPSRTVVAKYSAPYVKEFAMQPLSTARGRVEFWAMRKMEEIVPGSVPKPYLHDPEESVIVMEDLGDYEILRDQLNRGKFDISLSGELARHIAKLHRSTHKTVVDAATHREMVAFCTLEDMQFIRTMVSFDDPLNMKGPTGQYVKEVEEFTQDKTLFPNWQKLRALDRDSNDCLKHGDFHTSSVMVKGSTLKIFDFEMAHMGPAGSDLGHMLCNFVKTHLDHKHYPLTAGANYHERLRTALQDIVDTYFQVASEYLNPEDYGRLVSETAGFTGVRLIRRVWGIHEPGEELNQPLTDQDCLRIGYRLVKDYEKIKTTQELKMCILGEAK